MPAIAAQEAFAFHTAHPDPYLWLRTDAQISEMAEEGQLFCVRDADSGKIAALCYVVPAPEGNEWELGGLKVDDSYRRLGLGTELVRFALVHTIFWARPWLQGGTIIAHVHEENPDPRHVLPRAGFVQKEPIQLRVADLPPERRPPETMKLKDGVLRGDVFLLPQETIRPLNEWLRSFDGKVGPGRRPAQFDFGAASVEDVVAALKDMAGA